MKNYQIIKILSPKNKKMAIIAIVLASLSALFDLIGISSILPLLSVLANPELKYTNQYLSYLDNQFNFSDQNFIIFFILNVVS